MRVLSTVYDVARRDTFENLKNIWLREVDMYSGGDGSSVVKMLVANKVDVVRDHHTVAG